jgi:hypothetical protein
VLRRNRSIALSAGHAHKLGKGLLQAHGRMWCRLGALPRELWAAKVLPLLDSNDLVRVDSAIVSTTGRGEFSVLLKDHRVQINDNKVKGNVADAFQWSHARCLTVDAVKISRDHSLALSAVEWTQQLPGCISLSFSDVEACMDDGFQHVPSDILSCVNELYFGPYTPSLGNSSVDTDTVVAATILHFPGLTKLTVQMCDEMGPHVCQALSQRGKLLEEFSLVADVVPDAAHVISAVANFCPQLRKFTLQYNATDQPPTSASLALVAQKCPLLEELVVSTPWEYTVDSAVEVMAAANNLTKLYCTELALDGAALSAWVSTDKSLVEVDLSWDLYATDVSSSAAVALARLRDLQIHDVTATCGLQEALRYTTGLRGLLVQLEESSEVSLSLSIVTQLASTCRQLVHVELFNSAGLDDGDEVDAAFAALAENNRDLQSLAVSTCDYIGDRTVLAIAAHCPQFRRLDVKHGLRLTDDTLLALVQGCAQLTKIRSYSGTTAVTEAGLIALADHDHTCLEALCVRTSFAVSDSTRELLRERCPKLRLNLIHKQAGFLSPG